MKKSNIIILFLLLYIQSIATKPIIIGLQINPLVNFKSKDNSIKEAELGINSMVRFGIKISNRVTVGLGIGVGFIYEYN